MCDPHSASTCRSTRRATASAATPRDAAASATRVWELGWPFAARKHLRGLRLVAVDADWAAGEGPLVEGPIGALPLLPAGRTTVLPDLGGAGVPQVTGRDRAVATRRQS